MPTNGLLLTLSASPAEADRVRTHLSNHAGVSLGPAQSRWQPLAVETVDVRTAHEFHEWLEALPGVERIDVIYVGFDEPISNENAP